MQTKKRVFGLWVAAIGMWATLSGCGADIKSLFSATEVTNIDEFTDDNSSYMLITYHLNSKYCSGTFLKIVALKYSFDNPKFYNAENNTSLTCETLQRDTQHCRAVDMQATGDFTQEDIEGNTTCLLSTDSKPNQKYEELSEETGMN